MNMNQAQTHIARLIGLPGAREAGVEQRVRPEISSEFEFKIWVKIDSMEHGARDRSAMPALGEMAAFSKLAHHLRDAGVPGSETLLVPFPTRTCGTCLHFAKLPPDRQPTTPEHWAYGKIVGDCNCPVPLAVSSSDASEVYTTRKDCPCWTEKP